MTVAHPCDPCTWPLLDMQRNPLYIVILTTSTSTLRVYPSRPSLCLLLDEHRHLLCIFFLSYYISLLP